MFLLALLLLFLALLSSLVAVLSNLQPLFRIGSTLTVLHALFPMTILLMPYKNRLSSPALKRIRPPDSAASLDQIVCQVLDIVHKSAESASDTWLTDSAERAINIIGIVLSASTARRWHHYSTSRVEAGNGGFSQVHYSSVERLPLENINPASSLVNKTFLNQWLTSSSDSNTWTHRCELANDCSYVILITSIREQSVPETTFRFIMTSLIASLRVFIEGERLGDLVQGRL